MVDGQLSTELDGGTIGLTTPIGWFWIIFVFGALLGIGGLVVMFPIISAVGVLMMGFSAPTKLQKRLRELRSQLRPAEVAWQSEAGGTEKQSFWNSATIHRPKVDDRSWVFPAPGIEEWHLENRYAADAGGELIPEHPNRIGTPRPPMISNYGLSIILAFVLFVVQILMLPIVESDNGEEVPANLYLTYALIGLSTIWLLVSVFFWKRSQLMQDTPTSNIRSVAVGSAELVGQARPGPVIPPVTIVDGDSSKSVENLLAWRWTYEVYKCKMVTDSEGNTREECHWKTVRSDDGGTNFTIHDGTGGVAVHQDTFGSRDFGDHLIQWECRHDMRMQGLFTNLFTSGRIKRHRWTLYGLAIGDPCYLLATLRTRSEESMVTEQIDKTMQNALLEAVGEKSPGFKPRLEKGTELTALSGGRSQVEYLILPTITLLSSIAMLGL
ncbi:MAG: hypothetical protein QGF94_04885 [Candidatus Thalassarchaeaceae archaeon]|jgi:hypothetical protein|nr:hypothetical protein [Candidatus Thalassarchaeaceae archaeon]